MYKRQPLLPSEYVERNVRVTPFAHDPVATFIDRYGLSSVYVFSTDFPHIEGGTDPVGSFLQHTAGLDDATIERFFVENATLLFP